MSQLLFERGQVSDRKLEVRVPHISQIGDIEVRCYFRHWTDPLDWQELARSSPDKPHVVTHACGQSADNGRWFDGPLIAFGRDQSVVGAIPSGGPARLSLPEAAFFGGGQPLSAVIQLEEHSAWRSLRALVAEACRGATEPLILAGQREDLAIALVLFAARQAHPDRLILWRGQAAPQAVWQRFLHNAAIGLASQELSASVAIEPLAQQLTPNVLSRCVRGAHRLSHVIPAVIVRDGLAAHRLHPDMR